MAALLACMPTWVQRILLFFRKWRIQTLWWVQNWNLRHIYNISFLIFPAVFCAFGFKVWKKYKYDKKNFCEKSKKVSKYAKFHAYFEFVFFRHVFADNFFGAFFNNFFNWFKISEKFWVFWHLFWFFSQTNFLGVILVLFSNFDCKCAGNSSKKREIFFYKCVLEFNYATIKGFA